MKYQQKNKIKTNKQSNYGIIKNTICKILGDDKKIYFVPHS